MLELSPSEDLAYDPIEVICTQIHICFVSLTLPTPALQELLESLWAQSLTHVGYNPFSTTS